MYNAFWQHALFVRGQSFSVKTFDRSRNGCQVIRLGEEMIFVAFWAGAPSPLTRLLLAHAFFLVPTTSKYLQRLFSISLTFYQTICNRVRNLDTCLT